MRRIQGCLQRGERRLVVRQPGGLMDRSRGLRECNEQYPRFRIRTGHTPAGVMESWRWQTDAPPLQHRLRGAWRYCANRGYRSCLAQPPATLRQPSGLLCMAHFPSWSGILAHCRPFRALSVSTNALSVSRNARRVLSKAKSFLQFILRIYLNSVRFLFNTESVLTSAVSISSNLLSFTSNPSSHGHLRKIIPRQTGESSAS